MAVMIYPSKEQALQGFWESFGVPAYDENTVPDNATFPRITYQVVTDSFDNNVAMTASVWDYSTSWQRVHELTNDIANRIGLGGCFVRYTDGAIWIRRGHPFDYRMADDNDMIRRKVINITAEFISEN